MVVKPDGTLVPREDEPTAAAPSAEQTETIAAAVPEAAAPIVTPETTPESVPESTPESTGALPAAPEGAAPPVPAPEPTAAAAPPSQKKWRRCHALPRIGARCPRPRRSRRSAPPTSLSMWSAK